MLCELIESASLVIWDEALMTHRHAFEAVDRTFRDLLFRETETARDLVFGGKIVVLGGDLRQILPIVEGGTRHQIVDAAVANSPLWKHVRVLALTKNMRLHRPDLDPQIQTEITEFSRWVLDIGEGKVDAVRKAGEPEATWIKIPPDLLLMPREDKVSSIVGAVYSDLIARYSDPNYLQSRAILTPTNDIANSVNSHIVSMIPGEERDW
jgi:hypothetical protein